MDKFWPRILPGYINNNSFENSSIDVASKNCYNNYDTTACIRSIILAFLGCAFFFVCVVRVIDLHRSHHLQIHQYLVFYLASVETLVLTIKWVALTSSFQLEFTASYLKLLQFLIICHYFWSLVARILHRRTITYWCVFPLLSILLIMLSVVAIMGMMSHQSTWVECLAPHWLLLSVAELVYTIFYVIAGIYVTRNINSMATETSFKCEQKRELWSVIVTYGFSSLISLIYYVVLQILGNLEAGCSQIFSHAQNVYSSINILIMVIKYLLPILAMRLAFHPIRGYMSNEEQRLLGLSTSGSTTSTFTSRCLERCRQLVTAVDYGSFSGNSTMRKSSSYPAFHASQDPLLTPIYEDDDIPTQNESYRATASCSPSHLDPLPRSSARVRTRHPSGHPSKHRSHGLKIPVSLNQGPDEAESITPSSGEKSKEFI